MNLETRLRFLRIALVVFGLIFTFLLVPLMNYLWVEAWSWEPRQPEYEQMIAGVYATLGIFLIIASRNPRAHTSLIWFTVWSSLVHASIMAVQAIVDVGERANFFGDIPALFLVGIVLAYLMPRASEH